MPLEVLLIEMRRHLANGTEESLKEAVLIAGCHPRLQAVMAQVQSGGDTLSEFLKQIDGATTGIDEGWISRPKRLN